MKEVQWRYGDTGDTVEWGWPCQFLYQQNPRGYLWYYSVVQPGDPLPFLHIKISKGGKSRNGGGNVHTGLGSSLVEEEEEEEEKDC
jgi:hypothetical protein